MRLLSIGYVQLIANRSIDRLRSPHYSMRTGTPGP